MNRNRSADIIKMNLREKGWDYMDWIDLAQGIVHWRNVADMLMDLPIP
jgi:hypothetical protein